MASSVQISELRATQGLQEKGSQAAIDIGVRLWASLVVLCLGAFVAVLDTTIVNIAIPNVMANLHADLDAILWILNGYTLVYAAFLITGGRLGDIFGLRRLLVMGMAVFVASSLACALAQSSGELIAARLAQAVGAALLVPQTLGLIPAIFPPQRRGTAIGLWGGAAGLAAAVGPTLGGLLVTAYSWRAVFLVNLPVGLVAIVGAWKLLPGHDRARSHHLDLGGILLATVGLFGIVFALVEGQRYSWGQLYGPLTIPIVLVAGVALLGMFVAWERRHREPLLPLDLFSSSRNFSLSAWGIVAFQLAVFTIVVVTGLFFQTVLGLSPLRAGLGMLPMPITIATVGPLAGRLSDRVSPKYILMTGFLIASIGFGWLAAAVAVGTSAGDYVLPQIVVGIGMGSAFAVVMTVAMRGVPSKYVGAAAGVVNTFRQVGGAMGGAITAALIQGQLASRAPEAMTYGTSFIAGLRPALVVPAVVLLTAGIAFSFLSRDPTPTHATAAAKS